MPAGISRKTRLSTEAGEASVSAGARYAKVATMTRQNFPRQVKVDCIKRATRNSVAYCEECGDPAKRFQIDHIDPDGLTGKPVLENAMLLCIGCHSIKTAKDVANIARAKRREALHLGAKRAKGNIKSAGFPPSKPKREKLPMPPRQPLFQDVAK